MIESDKAGSLTFSGFSAGGIPFPVHTPHTHTLTHTYTEGITSSQYAHTHTHTLSLPPTQTKLPPNSKQTKLPQIFGNT